MGGVGDVGGVGVSWVWLVRWCCIWWGGWGGSGGCS